MTIARLQDFFFHIDIVSSCNLHCPSCPAGYLSKNNNKKKAMSLELFEQILEKAMNECNVTCVGLYNWTEPLIHPKVALFVTHLNQRKISSYISTNLNYNNNLEPLIRESPTMISISVSGFSQEIYEKGHSGGKVEAVKSNMILLADFIAKYQAETKVVVNYHRYKDNLHEEPFMSNYAKKLGFDFITTDALILPLEKVLDHFENTQAFSNRDRNVIDRLSIPVEKAINKAKTITRGKCRLQSKQIDINAAGEVSLCCAVFDEKRFLIDHYLKLTLSEIQQRRMQHSTCKLCIKHGLDVYYTQDIHTYT